MALLQTLINNMVKVLRSETDSWYAYLNIYKLHVTLLNNTERKVDQSLASYVAVHKKEPHGLKGRRIEKSHKMTIGIR